MKKRFVFGLIPLVLIAVGAFYVTSNSANSSPRADLNLSETGLALRGYDPVAYFTIGKPTPGDSSLSVTHDGATYHFSSETNKALFLANPEKYKPAYGGFCAYGVAVNAKVDGDPELWHVIDDKLYLNINPSVDRTWKKDIPGYINKAEEYWPEIKTK